MVEKMKLKVTTALIATLFLISAIAIVSPVKAANPNRILMVDFMAKGDDLDFPRTTNSIVGKIKYDKVSGDPSVQVNFHSKIYDESGEKVYAMKGMLKDELPLTTDYYFACPIFKVWFVNVWKVVGWGKVKTTDTFLVEYFRDTLYIPMPNTGGKYVSAQILMLLSPTAEYYDFEFDTATGELLPPPLDEEPEILEQGGWVLAAVIWDYGIPMDAGYGLGMLPVGPVSYLTKYVEK
jgi:hypothetical protein